jgi:putative PEP-CTERM system histidine kinase
VQGLNVVVFSYLSGFAANLILTILLLISWHGHSKGRWLIAACAVMSVWAGSIALFEWLGLERNGWIWTLEVVHVYVWLAFFSQLLHRGDHPKGIGNIASLRVGIHVGAAAGVLYVWLMPALADSLPEIFRPTYLFCLQILQLIVGMVLVEEFYRNARLDQRWRIKFFCVALGVLLVYDFYLYSDALLFQRIHGDLWAARGAIAAMLTPFIAVSAARNPDWSVDIFVSRHVVFHSAVLLGSGVYLLVMAIAGYYIKIYGGVWGGVAQIVFLIGAFLVLIPVMASGQIRARVRVFLTKNFFNYTYDYRQEWLRLMGTLSDAQTGLSLGRRVVLALGQVVESPSGVLWRREPRGRFEFVASYGDPDIDVPYVDAKDAMIGFLRDKGWIVNLEELEARPEQYEGVDVPGWVRPFENAWLLVPIWGRGGELDYLVLLTKPRTPIAWNWEVIDLLKISARLAGGFLALEVAAHALSEAQQFEGFNRLSAFVIHDLKNLVAQLSLVVSNAERHRNNPAFMQDAIHTVEHAVGKMNSLMSQLKNSSPAAQTAELDLNAVLRDVVAARNRQPPPPQLRIGADRLRVLANRDRLASAFEHIIHNAQDAAGKTGRVTVSLRPAAEERVLVDIEDNGNGMDEEFVRTRLFKPFDTTKGLTGMGIGAYESREYIRAMGGDVAVRSEPGKGTLFSISLPLASLARRLEGESPE